VYTGVCMYDQCDVYNSFHFKSETFVVDAIHLFTVFTVMQSDKHVAAGHDDCRRNPVRQTTVHVVFSSTMPGGREIISFVAQNGGRRTRNERCPPNWLLFHSPETCDKVARALH
jgi:hypothetical protein